MVGVEQIDDQDIEVEWVSMKIDLEKIGPNIREAEEWASEQFGDEFFRFGTRYYFKDESMLTMFKIRCLSA